MAKEYGAQGPTQEACRRHHRQAKLLTPRLDQTSGRLFPRPLRAP